MRNSSDGEVFQVLLLDSLTAREKNGEPVVGPGLLPCVTDRQAFITEDCVQPPKLE